jgi:hypothetical protein
VVHPCCDRLAHVLDALACPSAPARSGIAALAFVAASEVGQPVDRQDFGEFEAKITFVLREYLCGIPASVSLSASPPTVGLVASVMLRPL